MMMMMEMKKEKQDYRSSKRLWLLAVCLTFAIWHLSNEICNVNNFEQQNQKNKRITFSKYISMEMMPIETKTTNKDMLSKASTNTTTRQYDNQQQKKQLWDPRTVFETNNMTIPRMMDDTSLLSAGYIHVGKTGGSTIDQVVQNSCHSWVPKPCHGQISIAYDETRLSKLVTQYYHVDIDLNKLPESTHQIYIMTIRDPFDRSISSFLYDHPNNARAYKIKMPAIRIRSKYYNCFPTLQSFLDYIGDGTKYDFDNIIPFNETIITSSLNITTANVNCTHLARAIIRGDIRHVGHLHNNYQRILSLLPPSLSSSSSSSSLSSSSSSSYNNNNNNNNSNNSNTIQDSKKEADLFLIRTSHLWDDFKTINIKYFGEDEENTNIPSLKVNRNISHVKAPVEKLYDTIGRNRLCIALQSEYIAYFQFLSKGININLNNIQEAIHYASTKSCPNINFTKLLLDNSMGHIL